MSPWIASVFVIAALALIVGGLRLIVAGRRLQGVLMTVAALVILANLAILTIPVHAR
jgi:drug/metabolite transporter superfamily protein YnfA